MPVSAKVLERCTALLDPGETLRWCVPVQTTVAPGFLGAAAMHLVVTDRRIALLDGSWLRRDRPDHVFDSFPRGTELGPVERGGAGPAFRLGGFVFEVDDEDVAAVAAIDAERRGDGPPDPYPDA